MPHIPPWMRPDADPSPNDPTQKELEERRRRRREFDAWHERMSPTCRANVCRRDAFCCSEGGIWDALCEHQFRVCMAELWVRPDVRHRRRRRRGTVNEPFSMGSHIPTFQMNTV